jgi:hypothetical protein
MREDNKREERKCEKEESVEKIKKHVSFYAKESGIKSAYFSDMLMIFLYKNVYNFTCV